MLATAVMAVAVGTSWIVRDIPAANADAAKLSVGQAATASSRNDIAYRAVDGNESTYWNATARAPQWLKVDLGRVYDLSSFEITWLQNQTDIRYFQYTIDVSNDDVNYTTIIINNGNDTEVTLDVVNPASNHNYGRYVRLSVTDSKPGIGKYPGVHEFSIYGDEAELTGVSEVSLSPAELQLFLGAEAPTAALVPAVTPAGASHPELSWSSGNTAVATVSTDGTVTAISPGTAVIRAESVFDASKYAEAVITVTQPATGVSIAPKSLNLPAGTAGSLISAVVPDNASNTTVIWSSSNSVVASVYGESGNTATVHALAVGSAIITAATEDGAYSDTSVITVTDGVVSVTGVALDKEASALQPGLSDTLEATVSPAIATNRNIVWSTSNPAVAVVDSTGTVTAVAQGMAVITVTTEDGGYQASATATVTDPGVKGAELTVDAAVHLGPVVRTEQYNSASGIGNISLEKMYEALGPGGVKTRLLRSFINMAAWYTDTTKSIADPANLGNIMNSNLNTLRVMNEYAEDSLLLVLYPGSSGTNMSGIQGTDLNDFNYDEYELAMYTWLKEAKTRFPKLEYIEVINEPDISVFYQNMRGMTPFNYNKLYKFASRAVARVNEEIESGNPLKVGGPVVSNADDDMLEYINDFLDAVAANDWPLDFIAWHHYRPDPVLLETSVQKMKDELQARGLTAEIVISEVGYVGGQTDYNPSPETLAKQAAFVADAANYSVTSTVDLPINWTPIHATAYFKNQFIFVPQSSNPLNLDAAGYEEYVLPETRTGRYFYFKGVGQSNSDREEGKDAGNNIRIREIQFLDAAGNPVTLPSSNTPVSIYDGSLSTVWTAAEGTFKLDLGAVVDIARIRIAWGTNPNNNYNLPSYKFFMASSTDPLLHFEDLLGELKRAPFYNVLSARAQLGDTRLADSGGSTEVHGVRVLATENAADQITMMVTNYQDDDTDRYQVNLNVKNLPEGFNGKHVRFKAYLIDETHSNLKSGSGDDSLSLFAEKVLTAYNGNVLLDFPMSRNSVMFIELTADEEAPVAVPALSGLSVNGQPAADFSPLKTYYNIVLPAGSATVDIQAAGAEETFVVSPASFQAALADDTTRLRHVVTVMTADGSASNTYTLDIRRQSTDTSLSSIGFSVFSSVSFVPGQTDYLVELPAGYETVSILSAVPAAAETGATAVITQQPALQYGQTTGEVLVTAESGSTMLYTFTFATTPEQPRGNVLFQDGFEDWDLSDWNITVYGAYRLDMDGNNKVLARKAYGPAAIIYQNAPGWTDYVYEVKIKQIMNTRSSPAIAARMSEDGQNFYMFRIEGTQPKVNLYKVTGGAVPSTPLGSADFPVSLDTWYTLKMVMEGNVIQCYINDVLYITATDDSYTSGGVGARLTGSAGAAFDDVMVSELPEAE